MPTSPDVRPPVTYVSDVTAEEVARRAALNGRSVSSRLARLVADALGAGPNPDDQDDEGPEPLPSACAPGRPEVRRMASPQP